MQCLIEEGIGSGKLSNIFIIMQQFQRCNTPFIKVLTKQTPGGLTGFKARQVIDRITNSCCVDGGNGDGFVDFAGTFLLENHLFIGVILKTGHADGVMLIGIEQ